MNPSDPPTAETSATPPTFRERLRRYAFATLVGAAVVVWPGGPAPGQSLLSRPPAYERALRWVDIIRLRLSPWLVPDSGESGSGPDRPRFG
ncbi:MAG: hypothetical protein IT305_13175 [Chloroflexi bacterium]|nr:hypothetical protein [Chloroflexota bacterium]